MTRFLRPQMETDEERLEFLIEARDVLNAQIREVRARIPGRRRSRHVIPECGTESGYQRHAHYGDTADERRRVNCEPCRAAHARHNRERTAS